MTVAFIIGFILFVACGACVATILSNSVKITRGGYDTNGLKRKNRICGILAIVFALVFIIVPASIHTVEAGTIAVVKEFGKAVDTRTSGIYFDFWLTRKYAYYDLTVQQEDIKAPAYSSDAQTMDIEMVVQYQIQPEHVIDIINNYGGMANLANRIESVSVEKAKTVLSSKSAMSIIETRATVSPTIEETIKNAISDDYYVNITTVVVTNIDFSDAFESTVEDKMIAEQQKLKAEYEIEKAIIEAEKELEVAKLQAQAAVAEAEGNAEAKLAIADAEAQAIRLKSVEVARMLGFKIKETATGDTVTYDIDFAGKTDAEIAVISEYLRYIEYLGVWNGELPQTLVGEGGASIMLPLDK
ncbi:MAG: prohibitin family protein [Ruminococcus sp.]|nr:prohibitin family protein [Candidatus Apopatosoma intestinale]